MPYKQIKPKKIYEQVADAILEMIKQGELKPGDKLDSVEQLAENFQVGRSAIREALSALRAMGLIEIHQGEGTYVKEFDASAMTLPVHAAILMKENDLKNLLEVRKILEVGAVYTAALKRSAEDLNEIKLALDAMAEAMGNKVIGAEADLSFHLAIANASQNPLLVTLMNNVSDMTVSMMREARVLSLYGEASRWKELFEQHQAIYKAIAEQDPDGAQKAMLIHLVYAEEILLEGVKDE